MEDAFDPPSLRNTLPEDHEGYDAIIDLTETSWTETFRWRRMMLTSQAILLSNLEQRDPDAFKASIGKRSLIARTREIPYTMLVRASLSVDVLQFDWIDGTGKDRRARVKFGSGGTALAVTELLEEIKGWKSRTDPDMAWRSLIGRGIGLLIISLAVWLLLHNAQRISNGEAMDLSGGHKGTTVLLWKLAGLLGTEGIWLCGGAATLVLVTITIYQWRRRMPLIVWGT